jgi:4-amino-4-deoxy-L-arabinose transferase-like glycosyltransferase
VSGDRDDDKTQEERQDRQMIELLNELRVAMPGVQILFGFLLTVPFSQGFQKVTDFQRDVYFVTLLLAALSTACLIAPSTAHRVLFHQRQRPWLIEHANRMLIGGSAFLALALVGAVLLVTDYLFKGASVYVVPPVLALVLAATWYIRPALRRRRTDG